MARINPRMLIDGGGDSFDGPRTSADALAELNASIAASKKAVQGKNVEIGTIALEQAVNTGDSAAAAEAAIAIGKAKGGNARQQSSAALDALQAATPQPVLTAAQSARGDIIKWVGGINGSWQVIKGTNVTQNNNTNANNVNNNTDGNNIQTGDSGLSDLVKSLQAQIAALTASNQQYLIDQKRAEEAARKERTENAIAVLTDRFKRYGLASLVPKIKELAISGASEATITLQLQETDEYKQRFRANQDRIDKGLRVLDPGEYLALEDDYRQILRAYGLRQFDNDDYVTQFISNDVSTTELSNRVVTAVQRVQNADPAVLTTLRGFYGISDNDLVAYVLDPNQQFQKIERQVAAAEIGAAAGLQGLSAGVAVSEQLAAQGITKAQAQKGYATIADILPTAEKLSDIYGGSLDEYRQAEAEQEVFNTLASAQRKRQKLAEREVASFSGSSGLGRGSLSRPSGGNI